MSSITPIRAPLWGEQVLALSPPSAAEASKSWRRRPNLVPGRTLDAPSLVTRQNWAAGRHVVRAQAYTAGVVRGLEVDQVAGDGADGDEGPARLTVSPGQGLALSGEDVALSRAVDVALDDLPVVRGQDRSPPRPLARAGAQPASGGGVGAAAGAIRARVDRQRRPLRSLSLW